MDENTRLAVATQITCALLNNRTMKFDTKKQLVDNAIAYTDMLARRLNEIPPNAQENCEKNKRPRIVVAKE